VPSTPESTAAVSVPDGAAGASSGLLLTGRASSSSAGSDRGDVAGGDFGIAVPALDDLDSVADVS